VTSDWKHYLVKGAHRRNDDDAVAHDERRHEVYQSVLGTAAHVVTLPVPTPPGPLDVLLFDEPGPLDLPLIVVPGALGGTAPGQSGRAFTTLVTSGMSNQRMAYPEGTPRRFLRVELAMYLDRDAVRENADLTRFCSDVLMHHAKQPFLDDTFLAVGMVLPIVALAQGRTTFFDDPSITALVVAPPPVQLPEAALNSRLVLAGDGVNLFCLIPLTAKQERIARMDLGPHGAVRSFEAFAEKARLEPVYRGPARPEPAPTREPVGRLDRQIRATADGGNTGARTRWEDGTSNPIANSTTLPSTSTTTPTPTKRSTKRTKSNATQKARPTTRPKAQATSKADEAPPPKEPWWKFWA
jgi:hypothetical protein